MVRYFFNSPMLQPPRQASPATPPEVGELAMRYFFIAPVYLYYPVRLRLPPLHRRGISGTVLFQQPHDTTTSSGFACHPSTGGELAVRYFFNSPMLQPPRQASPPGTDAMLIAPVYLY